MFWFTTVFATKSDFPTTDQQLSQDKFALPRKATSARNTAQARHSFCHPEVTTDAEEFSGSPQLLVLLQQFLDSSAIFPSMNSSACDYVLDSSYTFFGSSFSKENTSLATNSRSRQLSEGFCFNCLGCKIWGTQIYRD